MKRIWRCLITVFLLFSVIFLTQVYDNDNPVVVTRVSQQGFETKTIESVFKEPISNKVVTISPLPSQKTPVETKKPAKKTSPSPEPVNEPPVQENNTLIENSFIGPYTSIGDNSKILNSNLEHCVILENVIIKDVERLEDSLIGKNAKVTKNQRNGTLKLHVGDYSEVEV